MAVAVTVTVAVGLEDTAEEGGEWAEGQCEARVGGVKAWASGAQGRGQPDGKKASSMLGASLSGM